MYIYNRSIDNSKGDAYWIDHHRDPNSPCVHLTAPCTNASPSTSHIILSYAAPVALATQETSGPLVPVRTLHELAAAVSDTGAGEAEQARQNVLIVLS